MRINSIYISSRVCASMLANGSSINRTRGLVTNARASATRYFMPPDNSSG
jgi:hypothetical protein